MTPRPVTWLLVLLASLVLPLAVASAWFSTTVEKTDRYVETVEQLADDPAVTDAAIDQFTARALLELGPPASDRPQVQRLTRAAVTRVITGPEFPPAWAAGNREAHRALLEIMDHDLTGNDRMVVDLAPLATAVVNSLAAEDLRIDLSGQRLSVEVASTEELRQVQTLWRSLELAGTWLPIAWILLVALTLLTARGRLSALGQLAIGSALALAVLWAGTEVGRALIAERGDLPLAVWDVVLASLHRWILVGIAIAAVALVVRIVLGLALGQRAARRPTPGY